MAKQETLTIFSEVEEITRRMSDEQLGKLMRAVMAYRFRGEAYNGDDVAVDIAFQFMSSQVDRSETAKAARSRAAQERWNAKSNASDMQEDTQQMQTNAPVQSNPVQSDPIQSNPVHFSESKADKPPAHAPKIKNAYGAFGWVQLTQEEYHRLLKDLGEAELTRCIAYVDESAQTTNNKNKWRDWNLVLRKCSRNGWGITQNSAGFGGTRPLNRGSGVLGDADYEAIARILQES